MRDFMPVLLLLALAATAYGGSLSPFPLDIPVLLEENRGQSPREFRVVLPQANMGLACDAVYQRGSPFSSLPPDVLRLLGANQNCAFALTAEAGSHSRYYRGAQRSQSIESVPHYHQAHFPSVYPGIDLVYEVTRGGLTATFQIARPSALAQIRIQADSLGSGEAPGVLFSRLGAWTLSADQGGPRTVRLTLNSQGVGQLAVDAPDASRPLTVRLAIPVSMPRLTTFRHAVDDAGNWAIASTLTAYAELEPGAARCVEPPRNIACPDVVVASFARGGALRYLVYLLGMRHERPTALATDPDGAVYVAGVTYSSDFVTSAGALQPAYAGPAEMNPVRGVYPGGDAFFLRLHGPDGGLVWSTYYGSPEVDTPLDLAVDGSGQISFVQGGQAVALNESASAIRWQRPVPPGTLQSARDGALFFRVRTPDDSFHLVALAADGSTRYERQFRGMTQLHIAPRADGSVWLAAQQGAGPTAEWTVFLMDAAGNDPALIVRQLPAGDSLRDDPGRGFWIINPHTLPLPVSADAPLRQPCNLCGAAARADATGNIDLMTYLPVSADIAISAAGRLFVWTFSQPNPALAGFELDPTAPPGPFLAGIRDEIWSSPNFSAGNVLKLFGSNIGPDEEIRFPVDSQGLAATSAGGVRVRIDDREAVLLSVSSSEVVILLPLRLPSSGSGLLRLERNGRLIASYPFSYSGMMCGILGESAPLGLGIRNEDGTLNSPDNPAPPGSVIRFHVVSIGEVTPAAVERQVRHDVLPVPTTAIAFRFGLTEPPAPLLHFAQSENYVSGIYEVQLRLPPIPPGVTRIPLIAEVRSFQVPQYNLPVVYLNNR